MARVGQHIGAVFLDVPRVVAVVFGDDAVAHRGWPGNRSADKTGRVVHNRAVYNRGGVAAADGPAEAAPPIVSRQGQRCGSVVGHKGAAGDGDWRVQQPERPAGAGAAVGGVGIVVHKRAVADAQRSVAGGALVVNRAALPGPGSRVAVKQRLVNENAAGTFGEGEDGPAQLVALVVAEGAQRDVDHPAEIFGAINVNRPAAPAARRVVGHIAGEGAVGHGEIGPQNVNAAAVDGTVAAKRAAAHGGRRAAGDVERTAAVAPAGDSSCG